MKWKNESWGIKKIVDLGLAKFRVFDRELDGRHEIIGPRGYLSSEVMNKWLGKMAHSPVIDNKSDVFQLCRVIGYITTGRIFTGIPIKTDITDLGHSESLFHILSEAFQYGQDRRPDIDELATKFSACFGKDFCF